MGIFHALPVNFLAAALLTESPCEPPTPAIARLPFFRFNSHLAGRPFPRRVAVHISVLTLLSVVFSPLCHDKGRGSLHGGKPRHPEIRRRL